MALLERASGRWPGLGGVSLVTRKGMGLASPCGPWSPFLGTGCPAAEPDGAKHQVLPQSRGRLGDKGSALQLGVWPRGGNAVASTLPWRAAAVQ